MSGIYFPDEREAVPPVGERCRCEFNARCSHQHIQRHITRLVGTASEPVNCPWIARFLASRGYEHPEEG